MPNPSPPDPSGRSSASRAKPAGSSVRPTPLEDVLSAPAGDDDSPTVISATRPRHPSPDAHLAESLAGRRLGHFELIESVGVGGMAAVIKANDLQLGRTVALKILPPDMAADPENITRFKQEARAAAKLDHENIARVYFCGEDQGLHFIAFEYVEGENLRVRTEKRGGILPVAECIRYMVQVAAGLSHAAARGVVHRDIKPSNIIITPTGKAKIVDMGLARNLDSRTSNGGLTQSGVTLGTFDYISPEQAIEPRSADVRSDIYSLGCTFYHVLTGHPAVPEGTAAKKLDAHQHVLPLDPRSLNPSIPNELAAILGRMMAKDLANRYQHPDHLIHHLFALADKLQISVGSVRHDSGLNTGYVEPALPEPPRLSPFAVAGCVAILLIAAAAITGGFGLGKPAPIDPRPLWADTKTPLVPAGPIDPGGQPAPIDPPVAFRAPRTAENAEQLVNLMQQGVTEIHLTANIDLTRPINGSNTAPEALFQGPELTLKGDAGKPPVVRLNAAADDGKSARPGAMTVRGAAENGRPVKVTLKNVHFEVAAADELGADTIAAAISVSGVDALDADQCAFTGARFGERAPAGRADVQVAGRQGSTPGALFHRCYFGPGSIGVRATGRAQVFARQCALAPRSAVFQMLGSENDPVGEGRSFSSLRLDHCSAILDGGAVIEIGDRVTCKMQAGHSLFSGPGASESGEPGGVLVRQVGTLAAETSYEPMRSSGFTGLVPVPLPNGYHGVAVYADERETVSTFAECETRKLPFSDPAARLLTASPWDKPDPRPLLNETDPRAAFRVKLQLGELRLPINSKLNLLGTRYWLGTDNYEWPLSPISEPEPRLAPNQKVWEPGLAVLPAAPNVYRTLKEALANVKEGDELLLRFNGAQEVPPHVFTDALKLTLKADAGFSPVLTMAKSVQAFLFKLSEGSLTFENIQFRLRPERGRAVVAMPAGGRCVFRSCVLTLEDGEGSVSAAALSDPSGEMMMMGAAPDRLPVPHIGFERCFVRGKGRLLSVKGSRPFELEVKDSLVALDGTFLDIEPTTADLTGSSPTSVRLSQVTAFLSGHLVRLQANSKSLEAKGVGLVPTHIRAENCLFAPASPGTPLVRLDRVENEKQMAELFFWNEPRNNLYGYPPKQEVLKIQPESVEAMPLKMFDADAWLAKWPESGRSFTPLRFAVQPESGASFAGMHVRDFELKSSETLPKPEEGGRFGVPLELLPQPIEGQ